MTAPLPEIEGKYEILEKLQVGGMGAIYKVRHRLLGDLRVIKVMRPQLMGDPALRERFHREAKAATRLTHPNIARLYDFSIDDEGTAYIVMEFIAGWTLDDLVSRGELPPVGLALEIAHQSLQAIGHLHTKGVVHRDISPDNLMLTEDVDGQPAVKLIDLGLVKTTATTGDLTATGVFLGKFRYASPEQFGRRDETPVGPYSDLYSFGLVLYELLTGRYPITGETPPALIAGHLFRPPLDFTETDPGQRVPEDLRRVVLRSLAKHPDERFTSAAAFAVALEPIRRRSPVDTPESRRLLELIRQPPARERRRPAKPGTTQSRFDRQFSTGSTPVLAAAAEGAGEAEADAAADAVQRIEVRIAEGDLAAAREALRQALETEGELPLLRELDERIAEIEKIARRQAARRESDELVTAARARTQARDLAGARELLSKALALWPDHPEGLALMASVEAGLARDAPRPPEDLRQILEEKGGPSVADAETTLLETVEDAAAVAETTLLPTRPAHATPATRPMRTAAAAPAPTPEPRPHLETRPHAMAPPEPLPDEPPALPARPFDEISLKMIPQQPRATAAAEGSVLDEMPLMLRPDAPDGGAARPPPARGELPGSGAGNRTLFAAALVVVALMALLIGFGLSRLRSGEAARGDLEVDEIGQAQLSTAARELLAGLESDPSPALVRVAEAFAAGSYQETLTRAAEGSYPQPREEAWARLLRAAARHALYELGGGTDDAALAAAREEVRACRELDAAVEPEGDAFSPSFRAFFSAAQ